MNCWHCKMDLIWGGDHTYEDYGMDGDGIVSNLTCPNDNCGVESVLVYYNLDNQDKKNPTMSIEQELQMRIDWYRKGLTEIYQDLVGKPMKARNYKDAMRLLEIVQSIRDGEPKTATVKIK